MSKQGRVTGKGKNKHERGDLFEIVYLGNVISWASLKLEYNEAK